MYENTLDIKTVCECNRRLGCATLHPQATIADLAEPDLGRGGAVKFEFYAVLLIERCGDDCRCCGREHYDYSAATMVFLSPSEAFRMGENGTLPDKGHLLAFHPDLLVRTSLKSHIGDYTFFRYRKNEALHLSQRETEKITCCFENIADELRHAVDSHSDTIISRHIELLLDYCTRYYERQFITRENRNKALMHRFGERLDAYMASVRMRTGRPPEPAGCAAELGLSEAYFRDLLKFETGKTFDEYFELKRLEEAKRLLLRADGTASGVARRLGYPDADTFRKIFEKITGVAPDDYRMSQN